MKGDQEKVIRQAVAAAKWVLAPMYLGLGLMMIVLLVQFVRDFFRQLPAVFQMDVAGVSGVVLTMGLSILLAVVGLLVLQTAQVVFRDGSAGQKSGDALQGFGFQELGRRLFAASIALALIQLIRVTMTRPVSQDTGLDAQTILIGLLGLVLTWLLLSVATWFRALAARRPEGET